MRLDELEWQPDLKGLKLDGYGFRRTRSDEHWYELRVHIWGNTVHIAIPQNDPKPRNAGIHILLWEGERVEYGFRDYTTDWRDLDPIVAQCILLELLKEPTNATR